MGRLFSEAFSYRECKEIKSYAELIILDMNSSTYIPRRNSCAYMWLQVDNSAHVTFRSQTNMNTKSRKTIEAGNC